MPSGLSIQKLIFGHFLFLPRSTYVSTNGDNETRSLKITRKQSTFGSSCQPVNDLCPIAALFYFSACQSAAGVLLGSRGAPCSLIGVAWSCSTWKKSQCHLVTLRHAAKMLAGGWSRRAAEEGSVLSSVVMNHCANRLPLLPHPIPNAVIIRPQRVGLLQKHLPALEKKIPTWDLIIIRSLS